MNFNAIFLKSFRVLLLPFSIVYGIVVIIRNKMYEKGWLTSESFNLPIICIGNLSVGGTGKSPMVEYLLRLLQDNYKIATVSRGYKRKTKKYVLASSTTTALEIGDEPMQFHSKFPNVPVAVGEERLVAVPQLLYDKPDLEAIILDDAFQHRAVQAGLNILLTDYSNLYPNDFFLPTGDLRDEWGAAKRSDIIIVTKCSEKLSIEEKATILEKIHPKKHQRVYFTYFAYGQPYHICNFNQQLEITSIHEVLLVCGIANPKLIKEYLHHRCGAYYQKDFNDHHIYSIDDLNDIKKRFSQISASNKIILTTEKDAVRLQKFSDLLLELPMYVLPVEHCFLFEEGSFFNQQIETFIKDFYLNKNNG